MKVLVCGGRDFNDHGFLEHALNEINKEVGGISFIINGSCEGADRLSSRWAGDHGIHYAEMPALWRYNGKSAGPKRNKAMLECIDLDLIVAFPGGKGTEDMVKLGYANDIEVIDLRDAQVEAEEEEKETDYEKFLKALDMDNSDYKTMIEELKKQHSTTIPVETPPYVFPKNPTIPYSSGIEPMWNYKKHYGPMTTTESETKSVDVQSIKDALGKYYGGESK